MDVVAFKGKLWYTVPVSAAEIVGETPWQKATEKRRTRPTTPIATASA